MTLIVLMGYFLDGNGKIRMHRVKEVYRGDPVTMFVTLMKTVLRGNKGFTCVHPRDVISTEPHDNCETCGSPLNPYIVLIEQRVNSIFQGEVLHFGKYSPSRLYGFLCNTS